MLAAIPFRFERVVYGFTPDLLDPCARPEPVPVEEGVMLVRGAWPELPPFAVSSVLGTRAFTSPLSIEGGDEAQVA